MRFDILNIFITFLGNRNLYLASQDELIDNETTDIRMYFYLKCFNLYSMNRTNQIGDILDEVMLGTLYQTIDNVIVSLDIKDILYQNPKSETLYLILSVFGYLFNSKENRLAVITSHAKNKERVKEHVQKMDKPLDKASRLRYAMIRRFFENDDLLKRTAVWLSQAIEAMIDHIMEGKGSVEFDSEQGKIRSKSGHGGVRLLKQITRTESHWWNQIIDLGQGQPLIPDKGFDLALFDKLLSMTQNLTFYERLSISVKADNVVLTRMQSLKDAKHDQPIRLLINIEDQGIVESLKSKLSTIISAFDKDESTKILEILQQLCGTTQEAKKLCIMANYELSFKGFASIYEESSQFRRKLTYERLFKLVNILKLLWNKLASHHPETWRFFISQNPNLMLMLYKAAFNLEGTPAFQCLCLMAAAVEQNPEINIVHNHRAAL